MIYKNISIISLILLLTGSIFSPTLAYDSPSAVSYIKSGTIEDWAVMALSSAGSLSGVNLEFLGSDPGSRPTDLAKRVLALTAAGRDSASAMERLAASFNGTEITSPGSGVINDDIFGLLALAAGAAAPDIRAALAAFIKQNQNADGGWSYAKAPSNSDSNMTAVAIMALSSAGDSTSAEVGRGFDYLESARTGSGFQFDARSNFGADSASTAWAVSAYSAAGRTPPASAVEYLNYLQKSDGSFAWKEGDASGDPYATTQVVIALAGKYFPVRGPGNASPPPPAPTPTPPPPISPNSPNLPYSAAVLGPSGQIFSGSAASGGTAFDTLVESARIGGFAYTTRSTPFGTYIESIAGIYESGLSGWLYAVNGNKPATGSANYPIRSGDQVLWFFAGPDDPVPAFPNVANNSAPPDSDAHAQVSLNANIENPIPPANTSGGGSGVAGLATANNNPPRAIVFGVDVGEINFGTLRPGDNSQTQSLRLTNGGTVRLSVQTRLENADDLYRRGLYLDEDLWQSYRADLDRSGGKQVNLTLKVPANYQQTGQKTGTLIFWATAK